MSLLYTCTVCEAHNMKAPYAETHSIQWGHKVNIQTPESLLERLKPTKAELVARGEAKFAEFIIDKNSLTIRCEEPCEHLDCRRMFLEEWHKQQDEKEDTYNV